MPIIIKSSKTGKVIGHLNLEIQKVPSSVVYCFSYSCLKNRLSSWPGCKSLRYPVSEFFHKFTSKMGSSFIFFHGWLLFT